MYFNIHIAVQVDMIHVNGALLVNWIRAGFYEVKHFC